MASKSKNRRRVFRASCILAALIIAGSSFAWFTSKDEVTNRLSASGDYGVRIVESFAPPANWLPGQEVNKDVYAVNTGDVEAFVEETVSGTLTITREKPTTSLTTPDTDCIELSAAERYAIEAGSYLAYAPTNSNLKPGTKVVAMTPDFEDENGYTAAKATDFTPDAAGLYVFRRVIDYPNEDNGQIETFEYDAYYYVPGMDSVTHKEQVTRENAGTIEYKWMQTPNGGGEPVEYWSSTDVMPVLDDYTFTPVYEDEDAVDHTEIKGKYYKVSNLTVTPDTTLDLAGDGVHTDGNLLAASAGFYKDVTETFDPTALKYEDAVEGVHPKRLVVTYDLGLRSDLEQLAENYDDALVALEVAIEEYNAALRDLNDTTNPALTAATNALQTALDNMRAAENAKAAAEKLVAEKLKAKNEAEAALTAAQGEQADAQQAYDDAVAALDAATLADDAAQDTLTAAETALGHSTDDPSAAGSAWAKYKQAQKDVEDAEDSARDAFIQYLVDMADDDNIEDADDAEDYLDDVTYDDLRTLDIDNDDVGYEYWELVVAEKRAKEAKDAAQDVYDAAAAAKALTAQQKQAASDAKDAAEAALNVANGAVNDSTGAQATYDAANAAYENARDNVLGKETDVWSDANVVDGVDNNTAWAKYNKAKAELETARTAYDTALENANADKTQLKAAEKNYAEAAQALSEAERAYNEAAAENDGEINIYVNLSDNVITGQTSPASGDKWQLLPESLVDTDGDAKADTAYFYYTSILGGGETSTKLIDSVTLDSAVTQDMFKYLDFDLNVNLKSAQIAMDSDGETILTTAADTILDADATLAQPTNIDTAITWSGAMPATPTSYTASAQHKVDGGNWEDPADVSITRLPEPKTVGGSTYTYQIVDDGKTYFGDGLTSGKVFKQVTATTTDGVTTYAMTENGDQIKLAANATAN